MPNCKSGCERRAPSSSCSHNRAPCRIGAIVRLQVLGVIQRIAKEEDETLSRVLFLLVQQRGFHVSAHRAHCIGALQHKVHKPRRVCRSPPILATAPLRCCVHKAGQSCGGERGASPPPTNFRGYFLRPPQCVVAMDDSGQLGRGRPGACCRSMKPHSTQAASEEVPVRVPRVLQVLVSQTWLSCWPLPA